jgi:tetratricopeptide (TPR) repeat protein
LRRASPYSPLTVAGTIRHDWSYAAQRAADWEKLYVQSPHVQGALGKQYLKQEKLDDAVRCLTRQVALQPEFEAYDALAEAWEKKKDEAKFIATWDEFLKQEDYGLSHAQARVRVAEHLMHKGKWQQALPYSEEAAGTGAQWAMDCAADCLTGLKRWPEAEEYTRASSERYPYLAPAWYFWCRRTNQGAVAAARSYAREVLGDRGAEVSAWYRAVFLTLEGQKAEALTLYRNVLKKKSHPTLAWHAVLLAEELKQPEVRDEMLLEVEKGAVQAEYQPDLFHSGELARAARDAMSDASKLPALAVQAKEQLAKVPDLGTRCDTAYVLGKFLVLHGQDAGWEILEAAAAYPMGNPSSTLAAVDLRERKAVGKKP